jgi:hypothetical protein
MRTGNLSPNALYLAHLSALGLAGGLGRLGAVDVGDALAQVEGSVGGGGDRIDLEEGGGSVLGALAALVAEVTGFDV